VAKLQMHEPSSEIFCGVSVALQFCSNGEKYAVLRKMVSEIQQDAEIMGKSQAL